MTKKSRPTYNPDFRLEATQLVIDQNYSIAEVVQAETCSNSHL
ncbi:transposase (fragment) [Shewanella benthica]|uniref:Transposase n=1 Tax=Shewanella benthica TaxID=43661 RepID=A0A330M7P3_9GAMM